MNALVINAGVLQQAYAWLCQVRCAHSANADVWDLRFHWETERDRILTLLNTGRYRFRPLSRIIKSSGENCYGLVISRHLSDKKYGLGAGAPATDSRLVHPY